MKGRRGVVRMKPEKSYGYAVVNEETGKRMSPVEEWVNQARQWRDYFAKVHPASGMRIARIEIREDCAGGKR